MHTHISIWEKGKPLFAGNGYAGLSDMCLYFIGGVIKHAKALNAFTNPTTNSYKRLVPGFEAPVLLAYSSRNRSASCRIPYGAGAKAKRVEFRFPDAMANPYLCYSALLMAGLDGIQNKIHPGDAMDKNLYDLPPEELAEVPTVCGSLREALDALIADHDFLLKGDVFTKDQIEAYVELKWDEVYRVGTDPEPGRVRHVLQRLIRKGQRRQGGRPVRGNRAPFFGRSSDESASAAPSSRASPRRRNRRTGAIRMRSTPDRAGADRRPAPPRRRRPR